MQRGGKDRSEGSEVERSRERERDGEGIGERGDAPVRCPPPTRSSRRPRAQPDRLQQQPHSATLSWHRDGQSIAKNSFDLFSKLSFTHTRTRTHAHAHDKASRAAHSGKARSGPGGRLLSPICSASFSSRSRWLSFITFAQKTVDCPGYFSCSTLRAESAAVGRMSTAYTWAAPCFSASCARILITAATGSSWHSWLLFWERHVGTSTCRRRPLDIQTIERRAAAHPWSPVPRSRTVFPASPAASSEAS